MPGPPANKPWDFDPEWQPTNPEAPRLCTPVKVPSSAWKTLKEWQRAAPEGTHRKRIAEIAMRVALISAAANHERTITDECIQAALRFAEWQERVRAHYTAGVAENKDAECASVILDTLKAAGMNERGVPKIVKLYKVASDKNWYRKYGPVYKRVLRSLTEDNGPVIAYYRTHPKSEEDDHSRPTGSYRLRSDCDDTL